MAILKIKSKTPAKKVVGAYLPLLFTQYLHLYSLAYEKSITELIQEALQLWMKTEPVNESVLVGMVHARLKKAFAESPARSKKDFYEKLKSELENKGIDAETINELLKP